MEQPFLAAAVAVSALAMVHVFAGKLGFLEGVPRSRWLSFAGGVSVAYVFVHLLPELNEGQEAVVESSEPLPFLEHHVYLVALVGLALFYGVECSTRHAKPRPEGSSSEAGTGTSTFWLSIGSFAVYNAIIGYLIVHREETTLRSLALFTIALGVHFVVNDFGLRERHRDDYRRVGRWILAAGVVVGWGVGQLTGISEQAIALLLGFIAGGVVLNVMKEELPEERESRFSSFALGAGAYAALLLTI